MRSLFWRVLATFWIAIVLVAGLSLLLGRALNQDTWIINQYPGLADLPEQWVELYQDKGPHAAQQFLESRKRHYRIDAQVLGEEGKPLVSGTFPNRASADNHFRERRAPWRQLTSEYTTSNGESYLFIYRIPHTELATWHRESLLWPLSALAIALVVITFFSLLLTLSLTRPLNRLRSAVHDLGQTAYQKNSLAKLATRRDELGRLAADFNRMGERLQNLISSQRQLLRDVSHELRSPLARLRIALALTERAPEEKRAELWPRLNLECDRLESLISEILTLARLDANLGAASDFALEPIAEKLIEDAHLSAPQQRIQSQIAPTLTVQGWPQMLERALDNLLRNALRFNPAGMPIELSAQMHQGMLEISVRDHGPGVAPEHLAQLGEPFYRAPGQSAAGHGLGLAIARRAAQRHGGDLQLKNHPQGGFIATLRLAQPL